MVKPVDTNNFSHLIPFLIWGVMSLAGLSLHTVIQALEMDNVSTLVEIKGKSFGKGRLFFLDGVLVDAECDGASGIDAAYIICGEPSVSFSFAPAQKRESKIDVSLSHILLEGALRQDELRSEEENKSKVRKSLQDIVDFFERSDFVWDYVFMSRTGKIVLHLDEKSMKQRCKGICDKKCASWERCIFTELLDAYVADMVRVFAGMDDMEKTTVFLEKGKAVLCGRYHNIIYGVFLAGHNFVTELEDFMST